MHRATGRFADGMLMPIPLVRCSRRRRGLLPSVCNHGWTMYPDLLHGADERFAQAKLAHMRYGLQWLMPQAAMHWTRVSTGVGAGVSGLALPEVDGEAA